MKKILGAWLLLSSLTYAWTPAPITIDGGFADWAVVLADQDNTITDGAKGAGDPDDPGQTSSDLRVFALTWDNNNLYGYYKRGTTSNSGITYLMYMDTDADGLMETGELLAFWTFNNAGFQGAELYTYLASDPSGDPLLGDGFTLPGSTGTLLSTVGNGAMDAEGVRFEVSIAWTTLGIPPQSPMIVQPSLTLGTNLPSQVEDNGDIINTSIYQWLIFPERESSAKPGTTVSFSHTIKNEGNLSDIAELTAVSLQGWDVSFWDATGTTPLTDTNGNGTVDTGLIGEGSSGDITVKVQVPASTPTQTNDEIIITAQSASNSSIQASVTDRIYAGYVVTFRKDQEKTAMAGVTVPYAGQVVENLTDNPITMSITTTSSQGWTGEVYLDANCDETYEEGPISQVTVPGNDYLCLITQITIPSGTPIGTTDETTTQLTFGDPPITLSVLSITHVGDRFTLTPDHQASQGPGESILYRHILQNNQDSADTFNITVTSLLGWTTTLLEEDGITPLGDSNGDGTPDTGSVVPFGGSFTFYVRVDVPSGANYNDQETTTLTATSLANPGESRSSQDTTTVKMLVTFSDSAYSTPEGNFGACQGVYFKAYGLSNGTYRFMVYEPSGGLKTLNPAELTPDQSGQVSDSYLLQPGDPTGTWSVKLQEKSGNKWQDLPNYLAYFDVYNTGNLTVASGRTTYGRTNQTLSVQGTAENLSPAAYPEGSLIYVVFVDQNGNNLPNDGEPYLRSDGVVDTYIAGNFTHETTPFSLSAYETKTDLWSVTVGDFVYAQTWTIYVIWNNRCPATITDAWSTFSVVEDANPPTSQITWPSQGETLYISASPFTITGTASDGETYVAQVEVSVDNGFTWDNAVDGGGGYSTWTYSWSPFYRGTYTLLSRATDGAGNVETPGPGITVTVVDDTPPTTPVVTDDGDYTPGTLHAIWSSEDPNSGIDHYNYCIGTTPTDCTVVPWTNVGVATEVTRNDLTLSDGQTYYFLLQATNLDGYTSSIGVSDGIVADLSPPTSTILDPPAGSTVTGTSYTITGTTSDTLSGVASVEISTDGGNTWQPVSGTTSWSYTWTLPLDGNTCLKARGTDQVGNLENPSCHWVTVDSYPLPPANLTAEETGFCQVALSWEPSPSQDIALYHIYSDQGTGTIDYTTPVAEVPDSTTTWTTPRGIYGYSGTQITLTKESIAYNQVHFDILNANKSSYTIDGLVVSWDADPPGSEKRVERVYVNGILVYTAPVDPVSNNGEWLALNPPQTLAAGGIFPVQLDFKYLSGGDPDLQGETIQATFSGGGWSPAIDLPLATSGNYPDPALANNLGSVEPGIAYTFGIRAEDGIGQEETNTTVTVTITACNSSSVQVKVASPYGGIAVDGQEVTVYGVLSKGLLENIQEVRFDYKPSSGSWTPMGASNPNHPNPDPTSPFFIHWDASSLPEDTYEIRAVAKDKLGVEDLFPYTLTLQISHTTPSLFEEPNASGNHQLDQMIQPSMDNPLVLGQEVDNQLTFATLYAGSFTTATTCHLIEEDPTVESPKVPVGWSHADEFRTLTIDSGETLSSPMDLAIPVNDEDQDRHVDTTGVALWDLLLYRYDGVTWHLLPTSVDLFLAEVRGKTTEFGLFAPLQQPYESGDTTPPAEVTNLKAWKNQDSIDFTWDAVTQDELGGPETIHHYNLYRGTTPDFSPDKLNHTNLMGISTTLDFEDKTSLTQGTNYFYLITAVDIGGNEGN